MLEVLSNSPVCDLYLHIIAFLRYHIFGMAEMRFPCYGILLIQGNLPRVFPVFTMNNASFFYPLFQFSILFHWEWPSFVFHNFLMCSHFVPQLVLKYCCMLLFNSATFHTYLFG